MLLIPPRSAPVLGVSPAASPAAFRARPRPGRPPAREGRRRTTGGFAQKFNSRLATFLKNNNDTLPADLSR